MTVEAISYTRGGSALVTLSGGEVLEIDPARVYPLGLAPEKELDEGELKKLREEAGRYFAFRKAQAVLARSELSKKGLIRRLKEKGAPEEAAKEAADLFEERGWVDDMRLAERLCEYYGRQKFYGRRRVIEEMRRRGVSAETAEKAAQELLPDEENILRLWERKYKKGDYSDKKAQNKLYGALGRLGYGGEEIAALIKKVGLKEREF